MKSRHASWIAALLLLSAGLVGCDGGRGSSGFDITENATIARVLSTQVCLNNQELTICPADQMPPADAATPTVTVPTPTATPGSQSGRRVDTGVADGSLIACVRQRTDEPCELTFNFTPVGFPVDATFRLASRVRAPAMAWRLAAPPTMKLVSMPPSYDAVVSLQLGPDVVDSAVQFSVLSFANPPNLVSDTFEQLLESGAKYAFVTREFVLEVITLEPEPEPTPTSEETETAIVLTATPTPTRATPESTATQTATPSETPTTAPVIGPVITYFGVARADSLALAPTGFDPAGRPIFARSFGSGISLIVEAAAGPTRRAPGDSAYDGDDVLADLQMIVSRPLGDGSTLICDRRQPMIGGVPAAMPFEFSTDPATVAAINDLGCRVDGGKGDPRGRSQSLDACTIDTGGNFRFVDPHTRMQFCLPIANAWSFPAGDTIVAARVRDVAGELGAPREIVIRVGRPVNTPVATPTVTHTRPAPATRTGTASPTPSPTPTPTPTATEQIGPTWTPSVTPTPRDTRPLITHFGLMRSDNRPLPPIASDFAGRPIYRSPRGQSISLVVEARPGDRAPRPGESAFDDTGGLPDMQMIVSRPLGDGSPTVCDIHAPLIGGVPATEPLIFADDDPAVVAAINDLGCRVDDGRGRPVARSAADACTMDLTGTFHFVADESTRQFCLPISTAWLFPTGDTIVAVRIRNLAGELSKPAEIVVRILRNPAPTPTPTPL